MLTAFAMTLIMYALGLFLILFALRGLFCAAMGLWERWRFEKALRRAGL